MSEIEITVRRFFTCDEGLEITPSTIFSVDSLRVTEVEWPSVLEGLCQQHEDALRGLPVTNLRVMTDEEVADFRRREAEEEAQDTLTVAADDIG